MTMPSSSSTTAPAAAAAPWRIRAATRKDVPALAALCAAAFVDNPGYNSVFLFAPGPRRNAALLWVFAHRIKVMMRKGARVLCAVSADNNTAAQNGSSSSSKKGRRIGGEQIIGVHIMYPDSAAPTMGAMLAEGLLMWPILWGLSSMRRALALAEGHKPPEQQQEGCGSGPATAEVQTPAAAGAARKEAAAAADTAAADARPPGKICILGVHPDWQQQGVGAALLSAALAEWDASGGGQLRLNTLLAFAVPFYERHGFRVTRRGTVTVQGSLQLGSYCYYNWAMQREAVTGGGSAQRQ